MSNTQSKSKSESVEPAVNIPRGTIVLPWSVKGRGKSATYCAAVPEHSKGIGQGTRVALVAKSGAVTFATLTEPRETVEGLTRWEFTRDTDRMTPEVRRANRAAKSAQSAAYWQSDAGLQTAERIAQRQSAKSEQSPSEPAKSEPEPRETHSEPEPAADDIATTVAMLLAGGMTASDAAAVGVAMRAEQSKSEPAKSEQSPSPSPSKSKSEPAGLSLCDACNRERRHVKPHSGAPELETCPRCSSLDADTARVRAERHSN